jgi:hypothetical protein
MLPSPGLGSGIGAAKAGATASKARTTLEKSMLYKCQRMKWIKEKSGTRPIRKKM